MTNKKKKGQDYSNVKPKFVEEVKRVIAEGDKHRYSVSAVFNAYNAAYGLNEKHQSCPSCLKARVNKLREWLKGYNEYKKLDNAVLYTVTIDGEESVIILHSDDKAVDKEGKGIKPGKYPVTEGGTLIVSVGSKGRYEKAEDKNDTAE